jgi:hypothetical protein
MPCPGPPPPPGVAIAAPYSNSAEGVAGGGMNPRSILTGLRGQRGKVVRQRVYNGTLYIKGGAHAVVRDALAEYLLGNAAKATAAGRGGGTQWRL